jgi:hypothetical protein
MSVKGAENILIKKIAMKTLILFLSVVLLSVTALAQTDSTNNSENLDQLIESIENKDTMNMEIPEIPEIPELPEIPAAPEMPAIGESAKKDTVQIRVGKHNVEIITDGENTQVEVEKIKDFKSRWEEHEWDDDEIQPIQPIKKRKGFDGHWGSFDFGGNMLWKTNYGNYPEGTPDFLALRPEKSFECNINFAEYSFGFGSYIGIVTGLGLNFNDYKFRNKYTIEAVDGMVQPVALPDEDFRLSKLSTGYLTAPLLLEIQIPGNGGEDRLFISGGLIGGLKMGEHTKTRIGDEKLKDKGDHYVSPLRWGYTARVGFNDMGIFATYYVTELFEKGKGPVTNPLTVGLSFAF